MFQVIIVGFLDLSLVLILVVFTVLSFLGHTFRVGIPQSHWWMHVRSDG